jgi:hypothetical protein
MDGFAFAGDGPWLLRTEAITAGSDPGQPLGCGEAVRIATGAMTRGRTTAVLRTEHAHVRGPLVFPCADVPGAGRDVRTRAENWASGAILAPAGTRVDPKRRLDRSKRRGAGHACPPPTAGARHHHRRRTVRVGPGPSLTNPRQPRASLA